MTTQQPTNSAIRALSMEFKSLIDEPVEGFTVKLANEENLFEWQVAIFGAPNTLYEGGYFKASMKFPSDYPYSPPNIKFLTKMFHPNIYENGDLCISILHPPVDDPQSGELPCERWNPTQNVRTVLLSVISLLNEPNTYSPANVDASVMFRRFKESKGKDKEYENIIRKQVMASQSEAEKDKVHIPTTVEEYCIKQNPKNEETDFTEFYDDYDCDDYMDDDDGELNNDSGQSDQEQSDECKTSTALNNNVTNNQTTECLEKSKKQQQQQQDDSGNEDDPQTCGV